MNVETEMGVFKYLSDYIRRRRGSVSLPRRQPADRLIDRRGGLFFRIQKHTDTIGQEQPSPPSNDLFHL
jgi:hypothetical protein